MQFKAFDPKVEVNGQTIFSVVDGMSKHQAMAFEILAKNGIKDLKPNEWYPQQAWLDAFKSISETIGPFTLCIIGKKSLKTRSGLRKSMRFMPRYHQLILPII